MTIKNDLDGYLNQSKFKNITDGELLVVAATAHDPLLAVVCHNEVFLRKIQQWESLPWWRRLFMNFNTFIHHSEL